MTNDILGVGIIGIGWYAAMQHVPHLRATGRADVVAINRRNPDRLKLAQDTLQVEHAFTDWREMLERVDLDAVVVSTPHHYHTEPTVAALEQGLDVLLEKPMALTTSDTHKMIDAARSAGRTLMIGYNTRSNGQWQAVKRVLEAGVIGPIRQISAVQTVDVRLLGDPNFEMPAMFAAMLEAEDLQQAFTGDIVRPGNWRADPTRMGGGTFVDIGSHLLDLVLWLGGGTPVQVSAVIDNAGWDVENFITAQTHLDNHVAASIMFGSGTSGGDQPFYGRGRLTIHGDNGLLLADFDGFGPHEPTIWYEAEGVRHDIDAAQPGITPAAAFVNTVLDGAPNIAPAEEAAQVVALTEAIRQSAQANRIIHIA